MKVPLDCMFFIVKAYDANRVGPIKTRLNDIRPTAYELLYWNLFQPTIYAMQSTMELVETLDLGIQVLSHHFKTSYSNPYRSLNEGITVLVQRIRTGHLTRGSLHFSYFMMFCMTSPLLMSIS